MTVGLKLMINNDMDTNIENGNLYVAFQVKNNIFATPMNDVWGIVAGNQNTIYTTLPNAPKHAKCIVELDGYLITIVNIPGSNGDIPIMGNFIVLLREGLNIGILATEVHLITILADSILEDKITGQKSYAHNGKIYLILDISQLLKDLDM